MIEKLEFQAYCQNLVLEIVNLECHRLLMIKRTMHASTNVISKIKRQVAIYRQEQLLQERSLKYCFEDDVRRSLSKMKYIIYESPKFKEKKPIIEQLMYDMNRPTRACTML